ncbi:hypothetical protein K437DRAFT_64859 [Tilletiaria anomala UBC 951]|uniref:Uncharacterized protein n=1 Tax=Tilletiaria anomala (strain ATCC 24038 / CBS 436.72 / UBC 951) TaxID=1037660 RepID=A0A066WI70_TILAU|nr:uncharacterized protein K437DRAFT_64859 [Tilletiaria anomala UBC 951]KDN50350.1 hypothetical protein K437DRAFT_64859 [Tilletiaria anomala UBC 951]
MPFDAEPVTSNADSATCRLTSSNLAKVPGLHDRTQDYVHYQMHFTAPIDQAFDVPNSAAQNAIKNVDRHTEEHRKRLEERRARRSERANILQDESKTTAQRIREDKKRRARLQQQREKKRQNSPAWASENDNGSNAKPKAAKRKLGSLPRSAQEKYKNVIASRRLTWPRSAFSTAV